MKWFNGSCWNSKWEGLDGDTYGVMIEPHWRINPELGKAEHDEWRWVLLSELGFVLSKRFEPIIAYLQGHFQAESRNAQFRL